MSANWENCKLRWSSFWWWFGNGLVAWESGKDKGSPLLFLGADLAITGTPRSLVAPRRPRACSVGWRDSMPKLRAWVVEVGTWHTSRRPSVPAGCRRGALLATYDATVSWHERATASARHQQRIDCGLPSYNVSSDAHRVPRMGHSDSSHRHEDRTWPLPKRDWLYLQKKPKSNLRRIDYFNWHG